MLILILLTKQYAFTRTVPDTNTPLFRVSEVFEHARLGTQYCFLELRYIDYPQNIFVDTFYYFILLVFYALLKSISPIRRRPELYVGRKSRRALGNLSYIADDVNRRLLGLWIHWECEEHSFENAGAQRKFRHIFPSCPAFS